MSATRTLRALKNSAVSITNIKKRISTGIKVEGLNLSVEDFTKLKNANDILEGKNSNKMNTLKKRKQRRARRAEKRDKNRGNGTRDHTPGRPVNSRKRTTAAAPVLPPSSELAGSISAPLIGTSKVGSPAPEFSTHGAAGENRVPENSTVEYIARVEIGLSDSKWEEFVAKARRQRKSLKSLLTKAGFTLKDGADPRARESWIG